MRSPGARSLKALGTYNFAGDLGKMAIPAAGALLVTMLPWRVTLALIGAVGLVVAVAVLLLTPRYRAEAAKTDSDEGGHAVGGQGGFYALLSIGVIDSATRMGLLTFLPFLLAAKGASLPTIGFALTLVFVGGAVGKLVCAWIGARIGVVATVWLTEGLTALGILALIVLPLEFALMLLPVDRRGAQRHVIGALWLGAAARFAGGAHTRVQHLLHRRDRLGRDRADLLRPDRRRGRRAEGSHRHRGDRSPDVAAGSRPQRTARRRVAA